jgi:hypothetical protein
MPTKRKFNLPIELSCLPADEVAEAVAEDVKFETILREARKGPPRPMVTKKSKSDGAKFMSGMREDSGRNLLSRIDHGELLSQEELLVKIGGNRQWLSYALRTGRIFSVRSPSDEEYFPSFFADNLDNRRVLGKVVQALKGLPAPTKYNFFVSESFTLQKTPLDALANGEVKAVLSAAVGFTER